MPILPVDIPQDYSTYTNNSSETFSNTIVEMNIGNHSLAVTSSEPRITVTATIAKQPLKLGERLLAFKGLFSEEELINARKRVAEEEAELGAPVTLARLRASKGMSQTDLAKKIDRTQANMSLIERGRTDAGMTTIRQLSQVLGVTDTEIIDALFEAGKINA